MTVVVRKRPWYRLLIPVTSASITFGIGNYFSQHRLLIPLISWGVSLIAGTALAVFHYRSRRQQNISGQ